MGCERLLIHEHCEPLASHAAELKPAIRTEKQKDMDQGSLTRGRDNLTTRDP